MPRATPRATCNVRNNHHRYPLSARQGFFWWEYDPTWYGLCLLSWTGLIWDLKGVPERVRRGEERMSAAAPIERRPAPGAVGPALEPLPA